MGWVCQSRDPRKETVLGWTREVSPSNDTGSQNPCVHSLWDISYWKSYIHLKLNVFR